MTGGEDCHCERSEAIQLGRTVKLDCFVALLLAMTAPKAGLRILATLIARVLQNSPPP